MVFICSLTPKLLLEIVALRELPINARNHVAYSLEAEGSVKIDGGWKKK